MTQRHARDERLARMRILNKLFKKLSVYMYEVRFYVSISPSDVCHPVCHGVPPPPAAHDPLHWLDLCVLNFHVLKSVLNCRVLQGHEMDFELSSQNPVLHAFHCC